LREKHLFFSIHYYNIHIGDISRPKRQKMKKMAKIISTALLSAAFIGISLYCISEETADSPAELIKEAEIYIERGDIEKAVLILDDAFESANSTGDHESLMAIGDLYITADSSLNGKAMKAWTAAGRWKCR